MLFPKFTIRLILAAMTVLAVLSVLFSSALKGQNWSIALFVGLGCAVLMFALYSVTFLLAMPFGLVEAVFRPAPVPTTPFATAEPPAQIIPPQEEEST